MIKNAARSRSEPAASDRSAVGFNSTLDGGQNGLARLTPKRNWREQSRRKEIILPGLVDDPDLVLFLGRGVWQRRIDLSRLQRHFIALVAQTEYEPSSSPDTL